MTSCTETKTSKEGIQITIVDPWLSPPPIYIDPHEARRTARAAISTIASRVPARVVVARLMRVGAVCEIRARLARRRSSAT